MPGQRLKPLRRPPPAGPCSRHGERNNRESRDAVDGPAREISEVCFRLSREPRFAVKGNGCLNPIRDYDAMTQKASDPPGIE